MCPDKPEAVPPGLQIERTQLAWERSALGFLAVAAALLFHPTAPIIHGRLILGLVAIGLALAVFRISRSRGRIAATTPAGDPVIAPRAGAVVAIGGCTAVLAAVIALSVLLGR